MSYAIRVENLGKRYHVHQGRSEHGYRTLRESLVDLASAPLRRWRNGGQSGPREEFWALDDVSFEVQPGEVVGIIGRNGAGKSTLLKILSRITRPTAGRVALRGRVGSLLEVGTGFHPELTGRENIYLNGAILGMSRREIGRKFDEIVDFAEIEKFIDTPVKRYSSGMYVRLAFAVAAHLDPEILIVDEVLAVGDAAFQKKCMDKMKSIGRSGRTILFVSHNLSAIRTMCSMAINLELGRLISMGPMEDQISIYLNRLATSSERPLLERDDFEGHGKTRFNYVKMESQEGSQLEYIFSGEPLRVVLGYRSEQAGMSADVAMSWFSSDGAKIFHVDNSCTLQSLDVLRTEGEYVCSFDRFPLAAGRYHVNLSITVESQVAHHIYSAHIAEVVEGDFFRLGRRTSAKGGLVFIDHKWI